MADTHETITDIIAVKRQRADEIERVVAEKMKRGEMVSDRYARELVADIRREADRLEAAYKRERISPDGEAGAAKRSLEGCDCAKLREAVDAMMYEAFALCDSGVKPAVERGKLLAKWCDRLRAALAAPPRNCDMPLVVDGPADNNADKAWLVFKRHNPDAYFDVPGLLRCIDWLFAPATEKEGGAK